MRIKPLLSKFLRQITKILRNTETYFGFHKMLHLSHIILIAAGLGQAAAAPRKHGHRSRHYGSECRTEYHDVYENEYEERETTECVTKWVPECKTEYEEVCRPKTKKVVS